VRVDAGTGRKGIKESVEGGRGWLRQQAYGAEGRRERGLTWVGRERERERERESQGRWPHLGSCVMSPAAATSSVKEAAA